MRNEKVVKWKGNIPVMVAESGEKKNELVVVVAHC